VLVVGDPAVGKTCVTRRYTEHVFSHHYLFTIGVDFLTKSIDLKSKKCILHKCHNSELATHDDGYTVYISMEN